VGVSWIDGTKLFQSEPSLQGLLGVWRLDLEQLRALNHPVGTEACHQLARTFQKLTKPGIRPIRRAQKGPPSAGGRRPLRLCHRDAPSANTHAAITRWDVEPWWNLVPPSPESSTNTSTRQSNQSAGRDSTHRRWPTRIQVRHGSPGRYPGVVVVGGGLARLGGERVISGRLPR
jgi:hypothetical protein